MSSIPFRVTHRRTSTSGRIPSLNTLLTGELYLQLADELIYFKNADQNRLVTVITDASGNGLENIKFSGASNLDIPYWSGSRFYPTGISSFVQVNQTGSFVISTQIVNFVSKSETGNFITTAQTGSFGGGNVDLSAYALKSQTGNFITTSQTGAFGGAGVDLSSYVTTGQTGLYAPAALTGDFITTGQTGLYAPAALTGSFITTGQTGLYAPAAGTGKFASLDESNYLRQTQIPNITGDVCINPGSNNSIVYKIQGYPIANTQPANGQTLQFNGSSWVPGDIAAGGNGGGGLVYYFNDPVVADLPTGNLPVSLSGTFELGRSGTLSQYTVTKTALSEGSYDPIVGFVSDVLDPNVTAIPAGLFDFNIWASSNSTTQTVLQLKVYKYDGATTTPTLLATSDDVYTYDGAVTAQYIMSIVLPQTSLSSTDRLFILISAKGLANNKDITLYFGGNTPSHVHTTIPSVGGSGLIKVINGIMQSSASALVDADVSASAAIAGSKIQADYFALANATGNFITTGQTGSFAVLKSFGTTQYPYNTWIGGCGGQFTNSPCAVLVGGSTNCILNNCSVVVVGGESNGTSNSSWGSIIGGLCNKLTNSCYSSVQGGICNCIYNTLNSNISNGIINCISNSNYGAIGVGSGNLICSSDCSIVGAGNLNKVCISNSSSILAGSQNTILGSNCSTILNGSGNFISGSLNTFISNGSLNATCTGLINGAIIGGCNNTLCSGANNSIILGGNFITGTVCDTAYTRNLCSYGNIVSSGSLTTSGNIISRGNITACGNVYICGTALCSTSFNLLLNSQVSNITSSSYSTTIGGIVHNISSSSCSIIAGGCYHQIANAGGAAILGGGNNYIVNSNYSATIVGEYNAVCCSDRSVIIGGVSNIICRAPLSSILNGTGNIISGTASVPIRSVSIIGSGITVTGTASNTLYVNNICACNGRYFGDASALTGLATGSFITTGMTGAFGGAGVDLSSYVTYSNLQYLDKPEQRCGFVVGSDFVNSGSLTIAFNAGFSCSEYTSNNNFIASSEFGLISSGARNNGIVGGCYSEISDNVCNSVILGGQYITGTSNNTAYAINYCSYKGKYYGDGSALTGLATGSFITTAQTGAFGGAGVDLSTYVTTGQTGLYAPAALTGSFITTGQTGNFIALSVTNVLATRTDASKGTITSSTNSTIIGGVSNTVSSTNVASIFGGCNNSITSLVPNNTIVGGTNNVSNGNVGIVVGGFGNSVSAYTSNYAGVFAGNNNTSDGYQSVIVGGYNNRVNTCSCQSAVISSSTSRVSGCRSVIVGGYNNCITGFGDSVILGGQNIVVNASSTAYANNFCSFNGKYYGDASALTGLATGSFVTTGMTGAFGGGGADLSNYVTTGQFSSGLNFSNNYTSVILGQNTSNCIVDGANNSTIIASCNSCITGASTNAIIIGSNCSCSVSSMNHGIIIGGKCNILCNLMSCDTIIIGGHSNCFYDTLLQSSRSVILGGSGIQANSTDTVFGNNFCAYNGKFYGDGSAITGLATGDFVVSSKCQVVARNIQPFHVCAVTRVASTNLNNALIEFQGGIGKAYLCDHDDASVDDCNLYAITSNGYCAAQFSAMILGNALYGGNIFTTSIRIDGVATSGAVLSQNKVINYQAFPTDDACVVVEDQQLKIYITGAQTGMHWGVRLDILGMQGYNSYIKFYVN